MPVGCMAALKRLESRPAGEVKVGRAGSGGLCARLGRLTAQALGRRASPGSGPGRSRGCCWGPAHPSRGLGTGARGQGPGVLEATTSIAQMAGVPSGGGASPRRGLGQQVSVTWDT